MNASDSKDLHPAVIAGRRIAEATGAPAWRLAAIAGVANRTMVRFLAGEWPKMPQACRALTDFVSTNRDAKSVRDLKAIG